jgi:hypothetical protein
MTPVKMTIVGGRIVYQQPPPRPDY